MSLFIWALIPFSSGKWDKEYPEYLACPVGPEDRTGVDPVRQLKLKTL